MRSKHLGTFLAIGIALVWGLASGPAFAADKVTSDRLLPPNVLAYLAIPDVPEAKTRCDRSLLGRLSDDPEFHAFWDDVEKQIDDVSQKFEAETGVGLKQLCDIPTGGFAAAFVHARGAGGSLVALLDVGESHESLDKLLATADEALKKQGAEKSTEERAGTQIVIYRLPRPETEDEAPDDDAAADEKSATDDEEKPAEEETEEETVPDAADSEEPADAKTPRTLAYFLKDSRFVVGSSIAILEQVLERWDGQHEDTFAENDEFQYIVDHSKNGDSEPLVVWYTNPVGIVQAAVQSFGQGNLQAQMAMSFLPLLGISELKGVGGGMSVAEGEFDTVSRTVMYIDYPTTGLLNAFQCPPVAQAPPQWVPQDASTFFSLNWDVAKAYTAIETLFDSFQGPGALEVVLNQLAEQEGGSNVHVKKDVLDQLTGKINFISDVAKSDAESEEDAPPAERFLVAVEVKDPEKTKALLEKLAEAENFTGEKRELAGTTFYEFEATTLGAAAGVTSTMGLGVIHGHVMIASNVTSLEHVLQPDPKHAPLSDSVEYRKLAAHFPETTSIIGFQQQDAQARTLYETLRSGQADAYFQGIDFSKLPPYEVIEKYLPATGTYVIPDEHGVICVSFSLQKAVEAAAK